MQVLLTNLETDLLTYYLAEWTNALLRESKSKTNKYYHLKREKVTRRMFESILDKRSLLSGKIVHALSCQSAAELGPDAVKKGAKAYLPRRKCS